MAATFNYYTPAPAGEWVDFMVHMELAGSFYVASEINSFIKATRHLKAGAEDPAVFAVREPENRFDKNAVRVEVEWQGERWSLGHMPREYAKELAVKYSPEMPLAASLIWVRYAGDSVYVKVHFLIPACGLRKANNWEKAGRRK